jgi:hypothetical protein
MKIIHEDWKLFMMDWKSFNNENYSSILWISLNNEKHSIIFENYSSIMNIIDVLWLIFNIKFYYEFYSKLYILKKNLDKFIKNFHNKYEQERFSRNQTRRTYW